MDIACIIFSYFHILNYRYLDKNTQLQLDSKSHKYLLPLGCIKILFDLNTVLPDELFGIYF